MGRTPTPTALKLLRGETRPNRLNLSAPKPEGAQPVMPYGMDDMARRVWHRQVRAMAATGVLTVVDSDVLRAYCEAVSRYVQAVKAYRTTGPMIRGRDGNMVRNPLHLVLRDNAMLIRLLAKDLAFLPAAREGLHVPSQGEPTSPFADWASGKAVVVVEQPR